ncbi:MAG: protein phosphatase CheZ [Hyphomicrobiales bacterium]
MGELVPTDDISEEDYQAIQEAVMETARGRWFLAEYARRNRVSETDKVLSAIEGVKSYISREHEPSDAIQMRLNIVDMTQKIEQIKTEIANTDKSSPNISDAQIALNVVLDETETATSTILSSAEQIQGLGWEIRERGGSDAECDKIDEFATEIYMACSFQDLTGQRLRKVVSLIEVLETSLNSMVSLWDEGELENYRAEPEIQDEVASLTNGPAMPGLEQGQDLIDSVMNDAQGIDINKQDYDEIEWSDEAEDCEDIDPFIIEDGFDSPVITEAIPKIVTEAETDDDVTAFEADTSEEMGAVQAEIQTEAPDEVIETPLSQDDTSEKIPLLEDRIANFN